MKHRLILAVRTSAAVLAALALLRFWPHEPLARRVPLSTSIWSADGELLRVTLAADDQYRLWTPLAQISPALAQAFLLKEDRWFYLHPGVNPVAAARASLRAFRIPARSGASTITMQLARMLYRLNTRTPAGKLRQMALALWLELRYSKHDLLEAYLNLAPFGGNIEGVGAASRVYFNKPPARITLAEALTLAVIPQSPASRGSHSPQPARLAQAQQARGRLAAQWIARNHPTASDLRQLADPIPARPAWPMPYLAPHFVDALLAAPRDHSRSNARIDTTLDASLQRAIERQVSRYIDQYGDRGIHNTSVLLLDTRDMTVKAWLGSADYFNESIDGQVDGVLAKRSPGSALKPFIYALALDQGLIHPRTILRDAPTSFGPFTPENFDGRFFGPIPAQDALIRSRNVPAVWVASQLKQPSLYGFLQSAGISRLQPESYYGLALALGGGEVTMEELATLYAMLANHGVLRPVHSEAHTPDAGAQLISPEAAFIATDILRHNPRPDEDGSTPLRSRWPIAWKTGTSWGFRDAWSAGIVGPYALTVWIGDFDARSNPAFVGIDAAAPLFFRIADAVNLARAAEANPAFRPPAGVSKVAVCAESGDLPNAWCPQTVDTWYIPGKSPIKVSQLHRAVAVDAGGRPTCDPAATARLEVHEFWSSDMLKLFREAGMPRRRPPALPDCSALADDAADGPRITAPRLDVTYTLRRSRPANAIGLEANAAAGVHTVFWFDGAALIGKAVIGSGGLPWRPSDEGAHLLRAIDDRGRSAEREIQVQYVE